MVFVHCAGNGTGGSWEGQEEALLVEEKEQHRKGTGGTAGKGKKGT